MGRRQLHPWPGLSQPPGLTLTPPATQHASIREVQALQARLQAIAPFIVRDRQGMQRVALADAFRAGVSAEAIVLGQRLVTLHNRLARSARRLESSTMTASDFAFIAPLWRYEAQSGILSHCGSFADPTVCPAYVPSDQCFSTNDAAIEHLIAAGYHRTAIYAGGASGHDYTRAGPEPTCGAGAFRTQAVIAQLDGVWTYQTQGPEPNPEIFGAVPGKDDPYDYDWPPSPSMTVPISAMAVSGPAVTVTAAVVILAFLGYGWTRAHKALVVSAQIVYDRLCGD